MHYKITNGSVAFGADVILERIDFEIKSGEKIAVVGRNGCGKTTLLKAIVGEVPLEEGTGETPFSVTRADNPVIGYLKQIDFEDETRTLKEEIYTVFAPIFSTEERMETLRKKLETQHDDRTLKAYSFACDEFERLGGYTYKKEYAVMVKSFGFTAADEEKKLTEFSGGQRTKISFIKLLLSKPDLLLLDEPTNHLDLSTVKWLEDYLKNYKSAIVIVSHDRMFINRVVNKVYEIEYGETRLYKGNYSDFERQKRINYEKQKKDHELQRAETERLNRLIERFRYKATKAKMVQSKIKLLDRMKMIDAPDRYDLKTFHADFQPITETGKEVLKTVSLTVGYEAENPLATIDLALFKGDRLGIIGDNGIGKSTFLKTIDGILPPLSGSYVFGANVQTGYFDQEMAHVKGEETVFENFHNAFPKMNDNAVRTALGAFNFSGEEVYKKVSELSGGERVRLALCRIFRNRPNVLMLDEPTNHMDIVGKETLENMLSEYSGTLIFVSHDRYFVEKLATKLLVFKGGKGEKTRAEFFPYGYDELERKEKEAAEYEKGGAELFEREKSAPVVNSEKEEKTKSAKKGFTTPLKEKAKRLKKLEKLEKLSAEADKKIAEIERELSDPQVYSDYKKCEELQAEADKLRAAAVEYEEEWLALSEEE